MINKDKLPMPFKVGYNREARSAACDAYWKETEKRVNSKPYRDAARSFLEEIRKVIRRFND